MNERLLQFIWQHQHFNRSGLVTEQGDLIEVINPGLYNRNQGPDFTDAKLRINATLWAGHIELHVRTSDWSRHHHDTDPNYRNIILHVVWQNDLEISSAVICHLPTLELQSRVPGLLLKRYEEMMNFRQFIPCEKFLPFVAEEIWTAWKRELLLERLTRKTAHINNLLGENNFYWEETCWWMIARNFGGKINGDAFELVARSIPLNILARHKDQLIQLEALLFGQAGLLGRKFTEHYPVMLQKEYRFLQRKYQLQPKFVSMKFLRMRPVAFPTIRLAQLSVLIRQSTHLFSKICESQQLHEVRSLFEVTANDYWHYHYRFEETADYLKKTVGKDMSENLLINTIIPMMHAFGMYKDLPQLKEKAIRWLTEITAEKNSVVKCWTDHQVLVLHASDSQALTELKTNYCDARRCLECRIGEGLLGLDKAFPASGG